MGNGGRGAAHVLSRGLSRVRYVSLEHLPKSARRSALLVQLQAWSPFPDSAYAVVMSAAGALVFAWDRSLFLRRAEAAGLPSDGVTVIPEMLLLPRLDEGLSLYRCASGCVGQYWHAGDSVHSRWWPEWPDADEWRNFQRGAGIAGVAQQPLPQKPTEATDWLERPWAKTVDLESLRGQGRLWEHVAIGTLVLLLLAPTLWLGRAWQESEAALVAVSVRKAELESRVKPILQARAQAEAAIGSVQAIAKLVDHADAVALLAHVSRLLPQNGGSIHELEWQGSQLHLSLVAPPGASHSGYVKALESGKWLRNVREAPDSAPSAFAVNAIITGNVAPAPPMVEPPIQPIKPIPSGMLKP